MVRGTHALLTPDCMAQNKAQGTAPLPAIATLLEQAITAHRQGRLAEAEQGYRQILARQPRHFDGLQLLGTIALQAGHLQAAEELIRTSLDANNVSEWRLGTTSAIALMALETATPKLLAAFDRAIAQRPNNPGCSWGTAARTDGAQAAPKRRFAGDQARWR